MKETCSHEFLARDHVGDRNRLLDVEKDDVRKDRVDFAVLL
jgi:hypothetical protein